VRRWLFVLVLGLVACQPQPPLEVFGSLPEFSLTDQSGNTFESSALAGRVTLLQFVYTHCTDACPLLSATFGEAQRKLSDQNLLGSRVMLVSLSVDPLHDSPAALAEYGQRFKADPAAWKLVTGDFDQVFDVVTGLKVASRPPRPAPDSPAPGGTELAHSTRVVLIDGQGQVRAYLDGMDSTADDLVAAAKRALR
jgi:cytochrome oxidase Cu insertion factor (SCO1/SenC/PrrC family)